MARSQLRMHVDSELLEDFRLLALADGESRIVGQHRQVQTRDPRSAKVRLGQPGAVPFGAVEGAGQQRGLAQVGVDEGRLREFAGQELAALQVQPRQIGEAEVAFVEGGLGQDRPFGEGLGEGRLVEAGAAKAAVDRMDVVEIAALERARREVAVDGLGAPAGRRRRRCSLSSVSGRTGRSRRSARRPACSSRIARARTCSS